MDCTVSLTSPMSHCPLGPLTLSVDVDVGFVEIMKGRGLVFCILASDEQCAKLTRASDNDGRLESCDTTCCVPELEFGMDFRCAFGS